MTVGPRVKPVTAASTPNSPKTCCSAAITTSLDRVFAFAGVPPASSVGGRQRVVGLAGQRELHRAGDRGLRVGLGPAWDRRRRRRRRPDLGVSLVGRAGPGRVHVVRVGVGQRALPAAGRPAQPDRRDLLGRRVDAVVAPPPRARPAAAGAAAGRAARGPGPAPGSPGSSVTTSTPKVPSRKSSSTASAAPTPLSSGPAAQEPIRPPAPDRAGPVGEPPPRWSRPVTASVSATQPMPTRPRSSGRGSWRSRCTPAAASSTGSAAATAPSGAAQQRVDPAADRSAAGEPDAHPDHDREPEHGQAEPVPPVRGVQPRGGRLPADRPRGPAGTAGDQQPAAGDRPADRRERAAGTRPRPRRRPVARDVARVAPPRGRVDVRAGTPSRLAAGSDDPAQPGRAGTGVAPGRLTAAAVRPPRRTSAGPRSRPPAPPSCRLLPATPGPGGVEGDRTQPGEGRAG